MLLKRGEKFSSTGFPLTTVPAQKGSTLKGENLLHEEQILPLRVDLFQTTAKKGGFVVKGYPFHLTPQTGLSTILERQEQHKSFDDISSLFSHHMSQNHFE